MRICHSLKRMTRDYLLYSIFLLIAIATSCKSDVDLIYESKGKPVVYCLLNPKDSIQYLRISRSFIIRGNPEEQAISGDSQILDEEFYAYLEYERPDGTREIHYFERSDSIVRDTGMFPRSELVLFQAKCHTEGGRDYGLYINFPKIPKLVAGSVTVVNPVEILDPNPLPGREITLLKDQGYLLRWSKSIKFAVYEPVIRFIFLEGDKNFQILRAIEMPQPLVFGNNENDILTNYVNGAGFIDDMVKNLTPPDSGLQRKIIGLDLELAAGGPELAVFSRSRDGGLASFTSLDEYSNLDGAVGIYSSRTFTGAYNNRFSDISINYIADGEKTRHLGFLRYNEDFKP